MYYTRGYMSVMLHTFNDKTESNASLNILIHPASKGTSNPIKEKMNKRNEISMKQTVVIA